MIISKTFTISRAISAELLLLIEIHISCSLFMLCMVGKARRGTFLNWVDDRLNSFPSAHQAGRQAPGPATSEFAQLKSCIQFERLSGFGRSVCGLCGTGTRVHLAAEVLVLAVRQSTSD